MCIIWLFGLKSNCDMYLSSSWGMIVKKKWKIYFFNFKCLNKDNLWDYIVMFYIMNFFNLIKCYLEDLEL